MESRNLPPCVRAYSRGLNPDAASPTAKTTIAVKMMAGIRDFTGRSFYSLRSIMFFAVSTKVTKGIFANSNPESRVPDRDLPDHNLSAEPVMIVLGVIVIVTRARGRQRIGRAALPGL